MAAAKGKVREIPGCCQCANEFRPRHTGCYTPPVKAAPIRFSLDTSIGRLARWLRLLGHDAAWRAGDDLREATRRARVEGRILLSRSNAPLKLGLGWPPFGGLLIVSSLPKDQLIEVANRWPIFGPAPLSPRCPECNGALIAVTPEAARASVPDFVVRTQRAFRRCGECGRLYWPGTHAEAIRTLLQAAADAARSLSATPRSAQDERAGSETRTPAREN